MEKYFVKINEEGKKAIFCTDNPNHPISKWWDDIHAYVATGISSYYIAKKEDGKYAIFHVDDSNHPISGWWESIWEGGLVFNQSNYYCVRAEDGKHLIFDKDDCKNPIACSTDIYVIYEEWKKFHSKQ